VRRVLIANRGEIAVRIIRACRFLGLGSVAVFSDADRDALHVQMADDAVGIGAADARESYLNAGRLVDAARTAGADAVHPGYGFLAESAGFAAAVRDAGLTFVGPPPEAIERLGDKVAARRLAAGAGVPIVEGFERPGATDAQLAGAARRLGLPVLIKAAAGGGGRGMRVVERAEDLEASLAAARREAAAAFGSGEVFLERYLPGVRHIEVQVVADGQGRVLALGERECSVQRRHQKLVEETPSVAVTAALRTRLTDAAVAVARSAGYVNAGSVEFLVEPSGRFAFLEVNTRLQVEHGITECTTGVDLVAMQLEIAAGKPLEAEGAEARGHAIECRVYAEDPARGFAPAAGPVLALVEPAGPGVRVDSGLRAGWRVPTVYDPLLSKVIVWDRTRPAAIARMRAALRDYVILGCGTNLAFLLDLLDHEAFRRGETTTDFIPRHFAGWRPEVPAAAAVAAACIELGVPAARAGGSGPRPVPDPWNATDGFRLGRPRA
jgi:acetyl-CoA carboxylase biotin carboxylase subunit